MNGVTKKNLQNPTEPSAVINSRMGSKPRDNALREEKSMTAFSPNINNNGQSIYRFEENCLVHTYEPEAETQRRENIDAGLGDYDDTELYIQQQYSFHDWDDGWGWDDDHDWEYVEPIDVYDQDGNYSWTDNGTSCVFNPQSGNLGAAVEGQEPTEEALLELGADGQGQIASNEPDIPNDAPTIATTVNPSKDFSQAASAPSPEMDEPALAPDKVSVAPAANNPNYQMANQI